MKTLVIIPTYNEKENIQNILQAIFAQNIQVEILVVDDNSPDRTGAIVQEMQKSNPRLHLLSRPGKQGLGKAYIAGFRWGIDHGFEVLTEMDADFSHRPEDLVTLLANLQGYDFAVGSRYVSGGRTVNWGIMRKIISRGGGLYSRLILGFPLNDWTGGFNAWKREVLLGIDLKTVTSNGYSFQIELKYKAMKKGFRGVESPIVFEDRRVGHSKMSLRIVIEAFYRVWLMRFK
ncbi:MAG: polyprenol monophosphomannose synthase [Bdellovibrionaceae bacterium]|nr:polyprenol monophosphomannose synthase [Pseudobdellovibrionaceae bacterium]